MFQWRDAVIGCGAARAASMLGGLSGVTVYGECIDARHEGLVNCQHPRSAVLNRTMYANGKK